MSNGWRHVWGMLALAGLVSGCASSPTYSPPERRAFDGCPIGEVWVCRDRYPSRLEQPGDAPMQCMCEDLRGVH
jgi:hypothetical protein